MGGARPAAPRLQGAAFTATALSGVAAAAGRRASASASRASPRSRRRCAPLGRVIAAVSISGPIERLSRQPGRLHAATVIASAGKLTEVLARHAAQQDVQNNV